MAIPEPWKQIFPPQICQVLLTTLTASFFKALISLVGLGLWGNGGRVPARLTGPGVHALLSRWQPHRRALVLIMPYKTMAYALPNAKGNGRMCCPESASPWKARISKAFMVA